MFVVLARPVVRIRIREVVVRVRIRKPGIRAVVRVATEEDRTGLTDLPVPLLALFEEVMVAVGAERDLAREGVSAFYLAHDVLDVLAVGEEFTRLALRGILARLYLDEHLEAVLGLYLLVEVDEPEGGVDELLLRGLWAVELAAARVAGYLQKRKAAVVSVRGCVAT